MKRPARPATRFADCTTRRTNSMRRCRRKPGSSSGSGSSNWVSVAKLGFRAAQSLPDGRGSDGLVDATRLHIGVTTVRECLLGPPYGTFATEPNYVGTILNR